MSRPAVGILATGSYLPAEEISNQDIAVRVGVTPEWIERKTQIRTRRFAAPEEATSDLATRAAADALANAGIGPERLDYLIVCTSTPDHPQPPTSHLVQNRLGAAGAACFDVNVVCSGFVYGLAIARALLAVEPGAYALVIGADTYSRTLDFTDRRTAVLFADGAGAALVGTTPPGRGIVEVDLVSRGDAHHLIGVNAGGSRHPASHRTVDEGGHYFRMDGRAVRDFVTDVVPGALRTLLDRAGASPADVDHFVPHQPNGVLLGELVALAGLGGAVTHRTLGRYGNVGCASVPVTLHDANAAGTLGDGDLVLLAGFGGGMALGSALLRW